MPIGNKKHNDILIDFIVDQFSGITDKRVINKMKPGVDWVVRQLESAPNIFVTCAECQGCARLYNGDLYCTWNLHDTVPEGHCYAGRRIGS